METEYMGQVDAIAIFKQTREVRKRKIFIHLIDKYGHSFKKVDKPETIEVLFGKT